MTFVERLAPTTGVIPAQAGTQDTEQRGTAIREAVPEQPRRSRARVAAGPKLRRELVPAFAGMTLGEQFVGLVDAGEGQGMTQHERGSNMAVLGLRSA